MLNDDIHHQPGMRGGRGMVERVHASELMLRKLHVSWRLEVKQVLLKTRKTYLIHMSVCVCV